jgi:aminopeptidase
LADLRVQNMQKFWWNIPPVVPGDRILIEGTTAAEPLLRELYIQILEKGGHPHLMMALPGTMPFSQDEMYLTYANDAQLDFVPTFYKLAYDQFEGRVRIHSATNTKGTSNIDPVKIAAARQGDQVITEAQFRRGADVFKWVTTLFPPRLRSGCGHEFEGI